MKTKAFNVYDYAEIVKRFFLETAPLDGPSCFPVRIKYDADNMTEPPTITCEVFTVTRTGEWKTIFSNGVDQNTSLEAFEAMLSDLGKVVGRCLLTSEQGIPYEEANDIPADAPEDSDLPF